MLNDPTSESSETPSGDGAAAAVPELTVRVIVLGLVLSVVMGMANVYLGLRAGMTVSASIPAAVVAMLILRGVFRSGTILEANQVQTAASAGESLAAGIIFTMPALILIGAWEEFDVVTTAVIAFTGGLLGILFMIPMRRVFVVDNDELKYPEGVACASVLRAGSEPASSSGTSDALAVIKGGLLGGAFKVGAGVLGLLASTLEGGLALGGGKPTPETVNWGRVAYFGGDVSPALLGVGFIVRLNVAVLIFIGGGLGWLIGLPLLDTDPIFMALAANPEAAAQHLASPEVMANKDAMKAFADALAAEPQRAVAEKLAALGHGMAVDVAWTGWSKQIRYVGVGAMVVGGVASIWRVRSGLKHATTELASRFSKAVDKDDDQRDLPPAVIGGLALLATVLVFGTYWMLTDSIAISGVTTVIMVIMSFFFTAVASYIVGLVGNSNSPVSGMTITAVLFTGVLLLVFGFSGTSGMVATLGVAAIVCCAACTSGDVCNDLKTGHLVGARPYRQQIMQVLGVAVASVVMAPIMQLLHNHTPGGIGGRGLPAPQAGLFASLVEGFFGDQALPWNLIGIGAGVGVAILIVDFMLEKAESGFRMHLMPIAVGMYLPFGLSVPILLGGVVSWLVLRSNRPAAGKEVDEDRILGVGVLLASGIIAGESLTGVALAGLRALKIEPFDLGLAPWIIKLVTAVAAAGAVWFMWSVARGGARRANGG